MRHNCANPYDDGYMKIKNRLGIDIAARHVPTYRRIVGEVFFLCIIIRIIIIIVVMFSTNSK